MEPPKVEILVSDGVPIDEAERLLVELLKRLPELMASEAEHEARLAHEAAEVRKLADDLQAMNPEERQIVKLLIQKFSDIPF